MHVFAYPGIHGMSHIVFEYNLLTQVTTSIGGKNTPVMLQLVPAVKILVKYANETA